MILIILALLGCGDGESPPAPFELRPSTDTLAFESEVGVCQEQRLELHNAGERPGTVYFATTDWSCSDPGAFDLGVGSVQLAGGASVTLGITYCPSQPGPCTGELTLLVDAKGQESPHTIDIVAEAWSPDDDQDGVTVADGDCDDSDPTVHPGATERENGIDDDCNGLIDDRTDAFDDDGDGFSEHEGDCDDDDPELAPDAVEVINGIDDDCNGLLDDGTDVYDDDGDGFSEEQGDCADNNPDRSPGALEVYNHIDDDCDQVVDDNTEGFDDDGDGVTELGGDCDDTNPSVYWGAPETPDGIDSNCNGQIDDNTELFDDDGDGVAEVDGDCNDYDPAIGPHGTEVANGRDDDCDGIVDEGTTWFDDDGDGMTEEAGDCDDANPSVHPGAIELPDGADNDCDGVIDNDTIVYDDDGDGLAEVDGDCNDYNSAISPALPEVEANQLDDDCDGYVDEISLDLSQAILDSTHPLTESGPLERTPMDYVYRPLGIDAMTVRYTHRNASGVILEVLDVPAEAALPAAGGFPEGIAEAWERVDGTVEWVIPPGDPSAGATWIGDVMRAHRTPLAHATVDGDTIERTVLGTDAQGHTSQIQSETIAIATTPSLALTQAPAPVVTHSRLGTHRIQGSTTGQTLDVPGHDSATDILLFANPIRDGGSEDDWAWACEPQSTGSGLEFVCDSAYSDNSQWLDVDLERIRIAEPAQLRCIDDNGAATTSCDVPPVIEVTNDGRWTAFVECPLGFDCMVLASPLAEWTAEDDDVGWNIEIARVDPLWDAGPVVMEDVADLAGLQYGYVSNLAGHQIEISMSGGNGGSFVRAMIYQLMIPQTLPVGMTVRQVRSTNHRGMDVDNALCVPDGAGPSTLLASTVTSYNPHYDSSNPSMLSRLGDVLLEAADTGKSVFDLVSDFGWGGAVSTAKKVVGLITSLFGLGDPQQDDGQITSISLTQSVTDPSCVDVATTIPHTSSSPTLEHSITLYAVYFSP